MRRALIPLTLLALTAAGCATLAPDATDAPVRYRCQAGKSFTAAYALHGKHVVVSAGGVKRTLRLARSGSGARYTAGDSEIWGKGPAATLKGFPGGPYQNCTSQ